MRKLFICCIALSCLSTAFAQADIPKTRSSIDAAIGFGPATSLSVSWNKTHGLGSSNKFRIGYGVRVSSFLGSDLAYTTAPAKLASDISKVDTLTVASANTNALNALINLQYQLNNKLVIGFNIDALGFSFGGEKQGNFQSSESKVLSVAHPAKPTALNVLLVGNNDIGTLKSEAYVGYSLSETLGIKLGADFTFSEYTTHKKLTQDNDRFRFKAMMFFAGVSYNL